MRLLKNQDGAIAVLVALAMTVLIGFTALVIDGGTLYLEKSRMQNAMDAAALAGAQELPTRPDLAKQQSEHVAEVNGISSSDIVVTFFESNTKIQVSVIKPKKLTFASALGVSEPTIRASATVQLQPLTAAMGVIPLGVDVSQHLSYGDPVEMKAGESNVGNFGALVLSGTGANNYRTDLQNGYQDWITVGNVLQTQTGNLDGPTQQALEDRVLGCGNDGTVTYYDYPKECSRVVLVPVYRPIRFVNQVKEVEIVGFATFFIESVGSSSEGAVVKGRFIQTAASGPTSVVSGDFGTYGYKLIE